MQLLYIYTYTFIYIYKLCIYINLYIYKTNRRTKKTHFCSVISSRKHQVLQIINWLYFDTIRIICCYCSFYYCCCCCYSLFWFFRVKIVSCEDSFVWASRLWRGSTWGHICVRFLCFSNIIYRWSFRRGGWGVGGPNLSCISFPQPHEGIRPTENPPCLSSMVMNGRSSPLEWNGGKCVPWTECSVASCCLLFASFLKKQAASCCPPEP